MKDMKQDNFEELEKELAGLKPVDLSDTLRRRIADGLDASEADSDHRWTSRWYVGVASLAATFLIAAGLYIVNGPLDRNKPQQVAATAEPAEVADKVQADEFKPVVVRSEIVGQHDDGPVVVKDFGPARRVRYNIVDDVSWRNEKRNLTLLASMPREEVVLVSLDTY